MAFENAYADRIRAAAYATLGFPGTYRLAFRDVPQVLGKHVKRGSALDFGCGAGRSTRFLKGLGFDCIGIDVSENMVAQAQRSDPEGEYMVVPDGDYGDLGDRRFDLVFAAFTFDNIPGGDHRAAILGALRERLRPAGRIVLLGSTPDIYRHEWVSFTTADFPENASARSGEEVRIVMKDVADARPIVDLVWFHDDYVRLAGQAGLAIVDEHRPLGREDDGPAWGSEAKIAPWVIYVLAPVDATSAQGDLEPAAGAS